MPRLTLFIDSLGSGGAQRQVAEIAAIMPSLGWRVTVHWYNDQERFVQLPEGARAEMLQRTGRKDPRFARRLAQALSAERTDVVHAFLSRPSMYAAVVRQTGGSAPVISAVRASALSFAESRLDAVLHTAAAHLGDHLTVNSEDVMTWMSHREVPPDRMSYVPNILPDAVVQRPFASEADRATALQAYGLSVDEPPIVLIGRFDEYKNQDGLVRAVAKLVGRGVKVPPLLLIGRFTDAARVAAIRQLAAANGMPKVVLAPPTSNALGIMQAARLVALTSHSEGTPNVVLEALGLGCHVVATPVGQVPDVVAQGVTGCLASDTTDEGIAAVLQRALAMPPEAVVKMGEAARRDVRLRFSAASAAALLDALYRRVMQQQRPARWRSMRLAAKHAGATLYGFPKINRAYKAGDR